MDNNLRILLPDKLELSREVEADIWAASAAASNLFSSEISGLGRIEEKDSRFYCSEIMIAEQKSRVEETRFRDEGRWFQEFSANITQKGISLSEFRMWWHSHGRASVGYSSRDWETITEVFLKSMLNDLHASLYSKNGFVPERTVSGPLISLVANARGEMTARCDFLYRRKDENGAELLNLLTLYLPVMRNFSPPFYNIFL